MLLPTDPASYVHDIPTSIAQAAHNGTSHVPERRAQQERDGYASTLAQDYAALAKYADTPEKEATLKEMFAAYRAGYRTRTINALHSRSRVMSTMITGGSNFPTARNRKRSDAADKRLSEAIDYREGMLDRIRKALRPELRPIMSGDDDATARLRAKLAKLETLQTYMREANAAIRKHAKSGADAQVAALRAIPANEQGEGISEDAARKLLQPDFGGRVGFAGYNLTNNAAEIRRIKARLESVTAAQATPSEQVAGEHAKLEDSPADNRVRLFFPGKPDAATRSKLKSHGFRWAPSIGCWQAYRNHRSIEFARRAAGAPVAAAPEATTCGCEVNAPEADPAAYACPCGDHCTDAACVAHAAQEVA